MENIHLPTVDYDYCQYGGVSPLLLLKPINRYLESGLILIPGNLYYSS